MSETWSDTCDPASATSWTTTLVAVKINGVVVFREVPDRGEGFREVDGVHVYTGTIRSRKRIRKRASDDVITFGD